MSAGAAAPPKVKRRPPFPRPRRTGGAHAGAVLDAPTAGHRQRTRERPAALIPAAARDTLTAYLNASDPDWWQGLSPHLTPGAQEAYADVDPSTIVPAALIPDAAAIVSPTDDAHLLTALVQIPTDKGTFGVALVREGGNDWLAWRIVLPGMPAPTEAAR